MNKKTIAYILIGAGALIGLYFLYTKMQSNAATAALGAGIPDGRGSWAAEDDALYQRFRGMIPASDLAWIDPYVKQSYEGGGCDGNTTIRGVQSKALNFFCRISQMGPNVNGTYPAWTGPNWANTLPSLWPQSTLTDMFNAGQALKGKYGGL